MQNLLLFFFIVLTLPLSAQHTSINKEDFNGDGVQDQLKCSYEIGSLLGGSNCELIDGKTRTKFNLTNYGCFCAIKKWVSVSSALRKKENEHFFYTLKKEVLPVFRPTPDQSLIWIINSSLRSRKFDGHRYFNLIFNPKTSWRQDKVEPPSTYYIEMGANTLSKIIRPESTPGHSIKQDQKDFLIYYGDMHFSPDSALSKQFIPVTRNNRYEILKTAHGVIVKKGASYKWVFVTDIDANASPQKLRWPSIEEVVLHDDHLIIKQSLAPDSHYNIYIVDIEKGVGGRLSIDFDSLEGKGIDLLDLKPNERFSVVDHNIVIGRKKKTLKFPLAEIKQELEILTRGN